MEKDQVLNVRIPTKTADALAEHKGKTDVPTSAFVRRAIEAALEKEKQNAD